MKSSTAFAKSIKPFGPWSEVKKVEVNNNTYLYKYREIDLNMHSQQYEIWMCGGPHLYRIVMTCGKKQLKQTVKSMLRGISHL